MFINNATNLQASLEVVMFLMFLMSLSMVCACRLKDYPVIDVQSSNNVVYIHVHHIVCHTRILSGNTLVFRYEQFLKDVKLLDGCAEHIGLILKADGVPLFKSCSKIYL